MKYFTTAEVSKLTGVPATTLRDWAARGVVAPVVHPKRKRTPMGWSKKNLRKLLTLSRLRKSMLLARISTPKSH